MACQPPTQCRNKYDVLCVCLICSKKEEEDRSQVFFFLFLPRQGWPGLPDTPAPPANKLFLSEVFPLRLKTRQSLPRKASRHGEAVIQAQTAAKAWPGQDGDGVHLPLLQPRQVMRSRPVRPRRKMPPLCTCVSIFHACGTALRMRMLSNKMTSFGYLYCLSCSYFSVVTFSVFFKKVFFFPCLFFLSCAKSRQSHGRILRMRFA